MSLLINHQFKPEGDIWFSRATEAGGIGNLLAKNVTLPGSSLAYPGAHCLESCTVCQLTTGESEINAATTLTSLMLSPRFNLTKTYFLIAGIAGINPRAGTINDIAFARYAVQVALQYEFDAREIPDNFTTGYVQQGAQAPGQYPEAIYGTEVFEVNKDLRDVAASFAATAQLKDTTISKEYRQRYKAPSPNIYEAATRLPRVIKCDVATSDVFFSGKLLGETFDNTTRLLTNGTGVPCMTAQEDNATLEAMIRFAQHKIVDFSRIIIMRSGANFDRPYPGLSAIGNLFYSNSGAFASSITNLYIAGVPVVKGILAEWNTRFEQGVPATNYVGDIWATLGGKPDFGPGPGHIQVNPVTSYEPIDLPTRSLEENVERSSPRTPYRNQHYKGAVGYQMARNVNDES